MKKIVKLLIALLIGVGIIQIHGIIFPNEIISKDDTHYEKIVNEPIKEIDINSIDIKDPLLILVNKENKLDESYDIDLVDYDGMLIEKRIEEPLKRMIKNSKKDGIKMSVNEAYRDQEYQQEVYDTKVRESMTRGSSHKEALKFADSIAAKPGYSEHETGLALDFTTYGSEDDKYEMWEWLAYNSYKYGFVLRYPAHKTGESGYIYEAWHYRYVGEDAASYMFQHDLILEELHERLK